jgi:subfamily B ATP-binding cassette protein MsbA
VISFPITSDVQEVEWSILSSLEMMFRDPITIVIYLFAMFRISPELTIFVILVLPVAGLLIGWIGRSLRRTSQKGQKKMGELLSLIEETISGLRIIKGSMPSTIHTRILIRTTAVSCASWFVCSANVTCISGE